MLEYQGVLRNIEWQTSLLGETHRNRFTQQSKTHFEREIEKQYVTSHLKFITIPTVSPNKIKHRHRVANISFRRKT